VTCSLQLLFQGLVDRCALKVLQAEQAKSLPRGVFMTRGEKTDCHGGHHRRGFGGEDLRARRPPRLSFRYRGLQVSRGGARLSLARGASCFAR